MMFLAQKMQEIRRVSYTQKKHFLTKIWINFLFHLNNFMILTKEVLCVVKRLKFYVGIQEILLMRWLEYVLDNLKWKMFSWTFILTLVC